MRLGKEGRKDLDDLLRGLRTEAWRWLQLFYAEVTVLHGASGLRECAVSSEKVAALAPLPARLFLDAGAAWEAHRPRAVSSLLLCLQALRRADGSAPFPPPELRPTAAGPLPVRLSFPWLFNFTIGLLLKALIPVCRRVTAWKHAAIGHALVLMQWDLSRAETAASRIDVLATLFGLVRQFGSLEYPQFFDFVVAPELLEEVVAIQNTAARPVRMILSPEMSGQDEKADAEELAKRAQLQVEKSHNPLGPLLYEFLLAEAESLSECFS